MRFGIVVANVGTYADANAVMDLAAAAAASGWEALLMWDHLGFVWDGASADPWLVLAAVAASTDSLLLGTAVTPVARYRPQALAQTVSTLHTLNRGNVILGVGLGGVTGEFAAFGEDSSPARRAAVLDEGLEVISSLWTGKELTYRGQHFQVDGVTFAPLPSPAVPIWVGGNSAGSLRRASHWNGWVADSTDALEMTMSPAEFGRLLSVISAQRPTEDGFEAVVMGYSTPSDAALHRSYDEQGATWWLEAIHDIRGTKEEMLERVLAGPAVTAPP
jgi:alkanesulfonate monooxygenase SsuD/methylene tetrahydromethanopterin reductase-like flavin-dependent oxidoreductase (luciferase family)